MKTCVRSMVFIAVFLAAIVNVSAQGKKEKGYGDVFALTEKIDGVYIPKDVEDAIRVLDEIYSDEQKAELRGVSSRFDLHFGLGMWMRNNWGLWRDSRPVKYFERIGYPAYDADGLSSCIISAYLGHLKGDKYVPEKEVSIAEEIPIIYR